MKICIDAGHGQHDPGAVGPGGLKEKDVALAISLKVGEKLEYNGFDIVYTRTNDIPGFPRDLRQNLAKRVSIANTAKADLFISIHCNSAKNIIAHGAETWIVGRKGQAEKLANIVQDGLVKATGLTNRGIKVANFHVLKYTQMPAILIETAFISNPNEEKLLKNAEFQERIATAIAKGVCGYAGVEYKEAAKVPETQSDYADHWAKIFIDKAINSGYLMGNSDGKFKPDNPLLRAEYARSLSIIIDIHNNLIRKVNLLEERIKKLEK